MKKLLSITAAIVAAALPLQAEVVGYWDFNAGDDENGDTGTLNAKVGSGSAQVVSAVYRFQSSVNSDPWVFDQSALRMQTFPAASVSNKTAGVEFYLNTTGYEGLSLSWEHNNNSSASKYWRVQYTPNNGATWFDHQVISNNNTAWNIFTADFKGVRAADNNPNFGFRFVSEFEGTAIGYGRRSYVPNTGTSYTSGGTFWVDVVTVDGTAVDNSNSAPTISSLSTQNTSGSAPTAALPFTVGDANQSADSLTLSWSSWTPGLIADVQFGGSGANRTVTVTPSALSGSATVTVRVTDAGGKYTESSFIVNNRAAVSPNTIAYWDFNSSIQDGLDTTGTLEARIGNGTASVVSATYTLQNSNNGDPWTQDNSALRMSNFPAPSTGNKTAGPEFRFSTVGREGIKATYIHNNSSTGSRYWRVQYTADGSSWTDHSVIANTNALWNTYTLDFSGIRAADNNPNFGFRLVAEFESTAIGAGMNNYAPSSATSYLATGTFWVDLVDVTGSPLDASNSAPVISSIPDQTVRANNSTSPIPFTVNDNETAANALTVSWSGTTDLIQDVIFGGSGSDRTITVIAGNTPGTATLVLRVTDAAGKYTETSFLVTIRPLNTPPTISSIAPQIILVNTSTNVLVTVGDEESNPSNLMISIESSNPRLLAPHDVAITMDGSERTLTFTPAINEAGGAWITVTVSDGIFTSSTSFMLKVMRPSVITLWSFNDSPSDASAATGTTAPAIGLGTMSEVGNATNSVGALSAASFDPETDNNSKSRYGNFPLQGESNKLSGVQFSVSTVGYQNIAVNWDHYNSATGGKYWRLQYTTNGVDFTDFIVYTNPVVTTFRPTGASFASIPEANNNPNFAIRLVSEFESTATGQGADAYVPVNPTSNYGSGGTLWLDMVTITGDAIGSAAPSIAISRVGNDIRVSWPTALNGTLEFATDLQSGTWQTVSQAPVEAEGFSHVTIPISGNHQFFRLRQ